MLIRILPIILISMLFVGCGRTTVEIPVEQTAEVISEEPETEEAETEEPESDMVDRQEDLDLSFDLIYDIGNLVPKSIEGEGYVADFNLYTGNLMSTDGSFPDFGVNRSRPCFEDYKNESLKYYPFSKEHGEDIRKFYFDLYNDALAEQQDAINELYVAMANEEAELGPANVQNRDITGLLPESLHLKFDGMDVTARVDKCEISKSAGESVESVPNDIGIEYWTRDDEVHYLTGIRISLHLITEDAASIDNSFKSMIEEDKDTEYIDYEATFNDVIEVERPVVEAKEVDEVDGEEETSDGELPPGKDFKQVTGYEGRWYYIPTGELTYELYSDGTGREFTVSGIYDITWHISGDHLMVQDPFDYDGYQIMGPNNLDDYWTRK